MDGPTDDGIVVTTENKIVIIFCGKMIAMRDLNCQETGLNLDARSLELPASMLQLLYKFAIQQHQKCEINERRHRVQLLLKRKPSQSQQVIIWEM